jgi:hypothetical protein
VMAYDELPRIPCYEEHRVTPSEWAVRIAARQTAVARRMLG